VLPYPISLKLGSQLSAGEYDLRLKQYCKNSNIKIRIVIPISGAAVGLDYFVKLTSALCRQIPRIKIFLVVKRTIYTRDFIRKMKARNYITVIENSQDKTVVDSYEKLYREEVIGLEIVKPSEQMFKAVLAKNQRGGAILLLTEPMGIQEEDNVRFLLDHKLLPCQEDQERLEMEAKLGKTPEKEFFEEYLKKAALWKAIRLSNKPSQDAQFIDWCLEAGIFEQMASLKKNCDEGDTEIAGNGVERFWKRTDRLIAGRER
ncbi:MAG: hypothetical protein WC686_05730, partial [Candidatus Shapirobacteria bacterium]